MAYYSPLVVIFCICISSAFSFRGLPAGLIAKYEESTDNDYNNPPMRSRLPRMFRSLDQFSKDSSYPENPLMARIQREVAADIRKINDQVGLVSRKVAAIQNNRTASVEEKSRAIQEIAQKYPKIAPSILNLISQIHKVNPYYKK